MLKSLILPKDVDDSLVRLKILNERKIEIGGGLGSTKGKIWRVIFDADKKEFGDKNLEKMQRRKYLPHIKTPIEFTDIVK